MGCIQIVCMIHLELYCQMNKHRIKCFTLFQRRMGRQREEIALWRFYSLFASLLIRMKYSHDEELPDISMAQPIFQFLFKQTESHISQINGEITGR